MRGGGAKGGAFSIERLPGLHAWRCEIVLFFVMVSLRIVRGIAGV